MSVDFREVSSDSTELTITHARLRDEAAAQLVGSGWPLCLDRLESLAAGTAARRP